MDGLAMRKNKARDLRRGILPSSARKGAKKDKRNVRHAVRRAERELLHEIDTYGWDDSVSDPNVDMMHRTREVVFDRRDADKVAPIMRWAEKLVERNPDAAPDELYTRARQVVGHSYMGDHAMSHIRWVDGFENEYRHWVVTDEERARRAEQYRQKKEDEIFDLINRWQDLWLKGRAKEVHSEMSHMSSMKPVDGWTHKVGVNYIYDGTYKDSAGVRRPRYRKREYDYWVNSIRGYDEIPERARECVLRGGGPKPYWMRNIA